MTMLRRAIGSLVRPALDAGVLVRGAAAYAKTGATPPRAYDSLIRMHCRTAGGSNDFLHGLVRTLRPPLPLPSAHGLLGDLSEEQVRAVAQQIETSGYYVFPTRLPEDVCRRLETFAQATEAMPFPRKDDRPKLLKYDRQHPIAETYHFEEQTILESPDMQAIIADLSLLAVAQAYLRSQPVLDIVSMVWSTTFSKSASHEAAQLYHFDMDRIKWLKFFIYLTDVTPENGPHCFVAGSHKKNGQPRQLLKRGYARIPDEDVRPHYPADAFLEFTGPRGTIIAEDTRGYHKGKPLQAGDRLILDLEFSDSLFGKDYIKTHIKSPHLAPLAERIQAYPRTYSKFILDE